ncbi:agmatine deiminase family protein [Cyclobacterium jeungdonense]|uniref:Agmatine deiminase family protein n=1 Tax=Cyclobacterium jeungdonense TaxID=708087 RepID=A0ABT8C4K5_9BACT|nr:agmatine deiminase family protein [Cyclobacterium jeungdonense]MDN3686984.1 agmatine deiminase family protein [Cyclobacterium jeungdonense]
MMYKNAINQWPDMNAIAGLTGMQGLRSCLFVVLSCLFFFVNACKQDAEATLSAGPVAEFDPQESTFICWTPQFQEISLKLIQEIARDDHVTLFYNQRNHRPENLQNLLEERKINVKNVSLAAFELEKDNIWIRDYGPILMQDEAGREEMVTFHYPHEENLEYNLFSEQYATKMRIPFMRSRLYSAGGGREINGRGTIILIEGHEKYINPDRSLEEIENEYKEKLNQKNVIWLKRGIPQDDLFDHGPVIDNIYGNGVHWHVDEFCRFADAHTILLAQVDPADLPLDPFYQVVHDRLEESYKILKNARDQDGKPFKIIRVPQAPIIFDQGQYNGQPIYYTPVTSYLNFILTNNLVVIPAYYTPGDPDLIRQKDEQAKKAFQEVFKSRKVVTIHATELNYNGGGLHCITMHQPKIKKRSRLRLIMDNAHKRLKG